MNTQMLLFPLHHSAFDRFMLGVHPSYVNHARRDILEEVDGPMLQRDGRGVFASNALCLISTRYLNVVWFGRGRTAVLALQFGKNNR